MSTRKTLRLLVDTGASVSLIDVNSLKDEAYISHAGSISISGAFGQLEKTIGTTRVKMVIQGSVHEWDFQVVKKLNASNKDGILGRDFLRPRALIDCTKDTIEFKSLNIANRTTKQMGHQTEKEGGKNQQRVVNLSETNKNGIPSPDSPRARVLIDGSRNVIEYPSSNIADRIMNKMGYQPGKGLGKNQQGITEPISVKIRPHRLGFGARTEYRACEEHINWKNNANPQEEYHSKKNHAYDKKFILPENDICSIEYPLHKVTPAIPRSTKFLIETNEPLVATIPARTETIMKVCVLEKGTRVCEAQIPQEGVYIANSIIKSNKGYAFVGVINTNTEPVTLKGFRPVTTPMANYHGCLKRKNVITNGDFQTRCHLLDEALISHAHWTPEEKASISHIQKEFIDLFHLPGDKLSYTPIKTFELQTLPGSAVVNTRQYRLPEAHKREAQTQIENMLRDGIIEPSVSPYNSPMILVPKKGLSDSGERTYRLCIDFRKLNEITKPYQYPLPRIEEILDQLGNAKYFTTLDLSQGFHQVMIDERDREKTAFSSTYGHYQYVRAPFGLRNLPSFFQSLLNGILTGIQGIKCFVYLDDVVVFGRTLYEHNSKLIEVLQRFRSSNLKLNPKKCRFLETEILYLGHKCTENGVEPDKRIIDSVVNFPRPKTVKQVLSFHGLANYYRKFIKGFSQIAKPLYQLTQKDSKFDWTPSCENTFKELKMALTSYPVLAYPDFSKEFSITCDASGDGVGAILEQEGRVIVYASKTLSATQKRWSATELELYAVVFGCTEFKCYVIGRRFKIYTDHMPLRGVLKVRDTTSRVIRLQQKLSEFEYDIIYKKGKDNSNADALSRNFPEENMDEGTRHEVSLVKYVSNDARETEDSEEETVNIEQYEPYHICYAITRGQAKKTKVKNAPKPDELVVPSDEEIEELEDCNDSEYDSLSEEDNNNNDKHSHGIEEIETREEISEILKSYHDSVAGGHFGMTKTYDRVRRKFHWKGMKGDIRAYVKKCIKCQKNKAGRATKMPLKITGHADKPFDKIYVDIVGPLPVTANGNKYILSMTDDLTRFVEFAAIPDQTAETIARTLYEEILFRYTIPRQIVSDNGANFVGTLFTQFCKMLKIKPCHTTPYHPQSNLVESKHKPLGDYLRNFTGDDPQKWDQYIRTAAHAYNNTPHSSTKVSPMEMLYGFTSDIPVRLRRKPEPLYNNENYCQELRYKLQKSHQFARDNLKREKEKAKIYHDKHIKPVVFHLGQKVFLKNKHRISKLDSLWLGPFEVTEINDSLNTTILRGPRKVRVHNNLLKPCHLDNE